MIVNDKSEIIWKEVFMMCFKVIPQDLPGGTKETTQSIKMARWSVSRPRLECGAS